MTRSLVENAGDAEQVRQGQRIERARATRYSDALARLTMSPDGEVLFEEIVERSMFFTSSYSADAMSMAHNEGRRSLGLEFLADWVTARPDALAHLLSQRALEAKRNG